MDVVLGVPLVSVVLPVVVVVVSVALGPFEALLSVLLVLPVLEVSVLVVSVLELLVESVVVDVDVLF